MTDFYSRIPRHIRTVIAAAMIAALTFSAAGCSGKNSSSQTESETSQTSQTAQSSVQTSAETVQTETSAETAAETETETETEEKVSIKGVVAIDPGHQGSSVDMSGQEPYAPGSSKTKAKASTGTEGSYSGVPEYQLNLDIGLMLRDELESRGYEVVMLRKDNDTAISNAQRAKKANESGADCTVRLHADGSDDSSVNGASALIPSADNKYVGDLHDDSKALASDILDSYCDATGIKNRGLSLRDDLTGTNWSKIPVALLEMGFMSNRSDDLNMEDKAFRKKMVKGIADGIDKYFKDHPSKSGGTITAGGNGSSGDSVDDVLKEIDSAKSSSEPGTVKQVVSAVNKKYLASSEKSGEKWSLTLVDLFAGTQADVNGDRKMLSASVLKTFIMAAAYDRVFYPSSDSAIKMSSSKKSDLKKLVEKMIEESDNDAANSVVEALGSGDFSKGMKVVNTFCSDNSYSKTSLGRRFQGSSKNGDNYTSSNDCAALLTAIYNGSCVSKKASNEMIDILKAQKLKNKIPAGLTGFRADAANKTGELSGSSGYVENDIAIVWGQEADYVLCVLSSDLDGKNSEAADQIAVISKMVYKDFAE